MKIAELMQTIVTDRFNKEFPEPEMVRVCNWCNGEVEEKSFGNDGLTVCQECNTVEGGTREITLEEWEKI